MNIFRTSSSHTSLLRVYTLRHCYEEAKAIDKSKHNQELIANCLILRQHPIKNNTDFGYKEQLKTNTLKKIFLVYLECVEDLIAFLWQHLQSQQLAFGMLFIENVETYFGQYFEYRECGRPFLIVMKLLRQLAARIKVKGRVGFSYVFNEQIFRSSMFEEITREEDFTNWELKGGAITKNGERYESQSVKIFFELYGAP